MKNLLLALGLLTAFGAATAEAQTFRFEERRIERDDRRYYGGDRYEERRRYRDDDDDDDRVRRRYRDDDDDRASRRGRAYGLMSDRPNRPHDNGLHRGWYKDKKGKKNKGRGRDRD